MECVVDLVCFFLYCFFESFVVSVCCVVEMLYFLSGVFVGCIVFIVDDDMCNIFVFVIVLYDEGMCIVLVNNGCEVICFVIECSDIDIVLMDIMMLEMDGIVIM